MAPGVPGAEDAGLKIRAAAVDVAASATCCAPASGANGFDLPIGSLTIGVEKSWSEVKADSVKIVPLKSIELTVRNVCTSVGSMRDCDAVVLVIVDVCEPLEGSP